MVSLETQNLSVCQALGPFYSHLLYTSFVKGSNGLCLSKSQYARLFGYSIATFFTLVLLKDQTACVGLRVGMPGSLAIL